MCLQLVQTSKFNRALYIKCIIVSTRVSSSWSGSACSWKSARSEGCRRYIKWYFIQLMKTLHLGMSVKQAKIVVFILQALLKLVIWVVFQPQSFFWHQSTPFIWLLMLKSHLFPPVVHFPFCFCSECSFLLAAIFFLSYGWRCLLM